MANLADCRPRNDRVLVRRDRAEDVTAGGLLVPDTAKCRRSTGTVVAVGPGRLLDDGRRAEMDLQAGDRVILAGLVSLDLLEPETHDDGEYMILGETEILAWQ